jgi:predicted phage terminase large subunit-like protein
MIKRTDPRILENMSIYYSQPRGFVGRNICYAVLWDNIYYGSIVGGSATKFLPGRDDFFGITKENKNEKLLCIVNNIFYHVEKVSGEYPVRNFTVLVLNKFLDVVSQDWKDKYENDVIGFESLVELPRTGEIYLRSGWEKVQTPTKGFTCKRVGGKGSDSWGGKRVWNTVDLRPKWVFLKRNVNYMPTARQTSKLSDAERQHLLLAIGEMRSRGLPVDGYLKQLQNASEWPLDDNGYFAKIDGTHFIPSEPQLDFMQSNARFLALIAARGSGKSATGAQKAIQKLSLGLSGMVINPDFENFRLSTWPEFREWIPWRMVVPSQRFRGNPEWMPHQPFALNFLNKAVVYCKGLRDPDSARGPNVNWLWYDEGGRDDSGMGWRIANAAVRISPDPQSFVTATPRGTLHWLYKVFKEHDVDAETLKMMEEAMGHKREIFHLRHMTIEDNRANLDPGYYASMLANYPTGWLRNQELYGEFSDEGTALGDPNWFYGKILHELPMEVKGRVRYWDLAASEKKISGRKSDDPDSTCGTRLSLDTNGRFVIEDQVSEQMAWAEIKMKIIETAMVDGTGVPIYIEQEGGAGGKNQVAEIASQIALAGFTVRPHNPRELGDKVMRAQPWFARASMGMVYLLEGDWNQAFLQQVGSFPNSKIHDDRIDSVSGCFAKLAPIKKWATVDFTHVMQNVPKMTFALRG